MGAKRTAIAAPPTSPSEIPLQHLHTIRDDLRDEVKRRIAQRNSMSIQMVLALGASFAVAIERFPRSILIAPLISLYYTAMILYSYKIHDIAVRLLREGLEPTLAKMAGTDPALEVETFFHRHGAAGIRRDFFWGVSIATTVISLLYFAVTQSDFHSRVLLAVASVSYVSGLLWIQFRLRE